MAHAPRAARRGGSVSRGPAGGRWHAGGRRARALQPVPVRTERVWRPLAVVLGLVAVATAILLYANRELAGDLFWLLAAGRYVDAHGAGAHDPFLTIAHGGHWYNQQWLSEWLLFQVQRAGGLKLVSFAYALVLGGTVAPLAWACRGRRLGFVLAGFALFVGSAVCVLQPRAAGLSFLAFALVVTVVYAARRRRAWLLLLPPLFALWANLHGAFLAGLLFAGLSALGAALARRGGRRLPRIRLRPALPLAAATGAGAVALLATPLGAGLFDYMRDIGQNQALPLLTHEWLPTWQHPAALVLLVAFCAFALFLYLAHPKPRPLAPALIAVGFALFALTAARQAVWLGPVAFHLVRELGPRVSWRVPRRLPLPARAPGAAPPRAGAGGARGAGGGGAPPAPPQPTLMTAGADYAPAHPPRHGRILAPTG